MGRSRVSPDQWDEVRCYASAGSCLISRADNKGSALSLFTASSLPSLEFILIVLNLFGVPSSSTLSVADSLLAPCVVCAPPGILRGRRAVLAELPRRVWRIEPSGSGVGVVLREEERECDSERSRPFSSDRLWRARCFSFNLSALGFSFRASFSRSSCLRLLLLKTRIFLHPLQPVHHSHPPSLLATSR